MELRYLSSQVTIRCDESQLSWKWLNICPPMGSNESTPWFALVTHTALLNFVNHLYLDQEISHFHPSVSIPHPSVGSERALSGIQLPARVKPQRGNGRKYDCIDT